MFLLVPSHPGSYGQRDAKQLLLCCCFCCDNLWKSIIMALEKPGKLRDFFF